MDDTAKVFDTYDIMRPFYWYLKIGGFWPQSLKVKLRLEKAKKNYLFQFQRSTPSITSANLIYFLLILLLFGGCLVQNVLSGFWGNFIAAIDSEIQSYGTCIQLWASLFISMLLLIHNLIYHKEVWNFFEIIEECNAILRKEFFVITCKKIFERYMSGRS